jgi:hypothetical protein
MAAANPSEVSGQLMAMIDMATLSVSRSDVVSE